MKCTFKYKCGLKRGGNCTTSLPCEYQCEGSKNIKGGYMMIACNCNTLCNMQGKADEGIVCLAKKGVCGHQELTPPSKTEIHQGICEELNSTYRKKNSDYGDSFSKLRKEFGDITILIRLSDKLERLKNLLMGKKREVQDESIEDSLKDLANYAILEVIERRIERGNDNE